MTQKLECQVCPVRYRRVEARWRTLGRMLLYALRLKRAGHRPVLPCHQIARNKNARRSIRPRPGADEPLARQGGGTPGIDRKKSIETLTFD